LIYPIVRDSKAEIRRAIEEVVDADFVLSSGGVSVGEYDFVKVVLEEMDARFVFWRVAMKPGKPLLFCVLRGRAYFGLPGNPVSSMMSFLQFVRPAIRKASGFAEDELLLPTAQGIAANRMENSGERPNYLRAQLRLVGDHLQASTRREQGSHMLTSMLGANGVVILGPDQVVEEGGAVELQIIPPFYT
jgi:molybdopterin molybdotransferase